MAILEVVLQQEYFSQEVINRWNYLGSGTPATVTMSFALMSALGFIDSAGTYPPGGLFETLRALQPSTLHYVETVIKDPYNVTDFYTRPFISGEAGTGAPTGSMSPTAAYGLRTNRVRQDIRRATKRFAGVLEGSVENGGLLNAPAVAAVQAVGDVMSDTLTYDDEGNTLTFVPIVVSKEKYTTPSGNQAYRYYPTEAEQLMHIAQGILWQAYDTQRTQTSRQYGRGS